MTRLDDVAGAKRTKSETARRAVVEIAEALLEMGGSAHREAVVDRVAIRRGQMFLSEDLRLELVSAFDRHRAAAARKREPALFHLPFGEGSRRWSLTPDAIRRLSPTEPPTVTATLMPPGAAAPVPMEPAADA